MIKRRPLKLYATLHECEPGDCEYVSSWNFIPQGKWKKFEKCCDRTATAFSFHAWMTLQSQGQHIPQGGIYAWKNETERRKKKGKEANPSSGNWKLIVALRVYWLSTVHPLHFNYYQSCLLWWKLSSAVCSEVVIRDKVTLISFLQSGWERSIQNSKTTYSSHSSSNNHCNQYPASTTIDALVWFDHKRSGFCSTSSYLRQIP